MILYNCCNGNNDDFIITKFDDSFNVESSYTTTLSECECPAGVRDTCRHRKMLPIFIASGHIDDNWFYNYDTHGWHKIDQAEAEVAYDEQSCPGHVASKHDSKICGLCGIHIDSLRPPEDEELVPEGPSEVETSLPATKAALNNLSALVGFDVTDDDARPVETLRRRI